MIDIKNFSFGYKKKRLLYKNLSLSLQTGSIYGLLGKNGAGKSTLLKNMVGLLFPTSGSISVNGFAPQKRLPAFLQTVYFIPEEVYLPPLPVKRYVSLFAPFYPKFNEKQFYDYLLEFKVDPERKLNTYSFGQQKKIIIAFALACNTRVLLMDEPTNGLDIPSKTQFRKLIASVFTEDRMIFISTHHIRDLDNLIDKVVIVDNGELLLNTSLENIGEKLCFKTVRETNGIPGILYSEESLTGITIVAENNGNEESKVNLELLFNAATGNPELARKIFN
jgi:ABC-2 type transport system ATP-binding protein